MKNSVELMWERYIQSLPEASRKGKEYTSWAFGDGPLMARELADLVKNGEKTGTCSLFSFYEAENEPMPFVGELNIITDWNNEAEVITETTNVQVLPFNEVSAEFAAKEGEGDKSYEYWKRAHVEFFTNELNEMGESFDEKMLVVCEEFKVIFQ
ncbi:ASCH domain-containing protein [Virgibacillus flavescens]|uniref:ASCH domain-containing protein n=1 Tax=Virgibacillus flavescens TaxID=1611422 RepID=UPI003D33245E